ncbi:MAG TPA: hypothetical protein VFG72_07290 [Marmoricola sp.]|nr:hypothetical protein [Marmoricola sp.]
MLTIVVTYTDGSSERIQGATDWDVTKDGHLTAWDDAGDVVAERDDVTTALHDRPAR